MLQKYINESILILAEDSHFDKLKKSAEDVVKKHLKSKSKILSYTLTVLDNNVTLNNPDINEVKSLISASWNTFVSNVKDTPIAYIKVVMLEALSLVSKDTMNACIIWYAARHVIKFFSFGDKEKNIIEDFLNQLGERIESASIEEWGLSKISLSPSYVTGITFVPIDKTKLEAHLKAASTTKDYGGENPSSTADVDSWHTYFTKRATLGITEEVTTFVKGIAGKLNANENMLVEYISAIQDNVQAQSLRSELLWWKECGYSPNMGQGYDEFKNGPLQLLLANDYASFLPILCPISVDFFLKNVHEKLTSPTDLTFSEFVSLIEIAKEDCRKFIKEPTIELGKITLLAFLQGVVWDKYTNEQLDQLLGIPGNSKISLKEICLWLFHDYQISKIITLKK